ncbi:hypothetical protein [Rhizobium johnstonii]|uniref:hypothetical protein n=1 Tax=Rhizobium johnstonii TaxID=3019933 RepID=UPI003F965E02
MQGLKKVLGWIEAALEKHGILLEERPLLVDQTELGNHERISVDKPVDIDP